MTVWNRMMFHGPPACGSAILLLVGMLATVPGARAQHDGPYPWHTTTTAQDTITARFIPPPGYRRDVASPGSFAHWLRHLPLKPVGTPVRLHDGRLKPRQGVHLAVVDIDTGRRDLQQCADVIMRLRSEYLFARGRATEIAFNFTSGDRAAFSRWADGWRPRVKGNKVRWVRTGTPDSGHATLSRYLRTVFTYAGTYSLRREMAPVRPAANMRIGDAFIQGGFPGHAVLVADMAAHPRTGEKAFLLIQGYTPAQDLHVLKNPADAAGGVWYPVRFGDRLTTPEWRFKATDLRRFKEPGRG